MRRFKKVHAITFNYGQRHAKEIMAAIDICNLVNCEHEVLRLPVETLHGTSPLISGSDLEQYENHEALPGGLEKTFVPMRNQLFLTIAANRAYTLNTNVIVTGVSAEDYGGYPDCRPDFIAAMVVASSLGAFTGKDGAPSSLRILTPLMHKDKEATVNMALGLSDIDNTRPNCYQALAFSHTAYDGKFPPTGKDHASLLRAKGFELAMVPDPLVLRAVYMGEMEMPDTKNYEDIGEYEDLVREVMIYV
jgi:7-cyano-7-deazaguanine synthase